MPTPTVDTSDGYRPGLDDIRTGGIDLNKPRIRAALAAALALAAAPHGFTVAEAVAEVTGILAPPRRTH